ncbi:DUF2254 domain-containing protein [Pseudooctadecabacter sp.]|uniref:DUF2254 domain-containing protein n=1 Tax=Pseudooctadecabacter sp. TaxID=1966338 RepID=UPI0035C7EEC8
MAWRLIDDVSRELWARVVILGALAVVALGLAILVGPLLPEKISGYVSGQAADRLLSIIANAMLAVTTFSLTVMVTVYRNSSTQFTPRLHRLIMQDPTTQNTLASFIGAYVFALIAIILRELGVFSDDRALVLFAMTVLVLAYVVFSLIRWVLHLQTFGSLMNATREIEDITGRQFRERLDNPCLGANPWAEGVTVPDGATAVRSEETGYIQRIYQESLQDKAAEYGRHVYLRVSPGSFVMKGDVLAQVCTSDTVELDEDARDFADVLRAHFGVGDVRTYEQDPRFGLVVLGEIASKALSPGINDPGTAIDVITRTSRILTLYRDETANDTEVAHDRLWIKPICPHDIIEDAFSALARDGAGLVEVQQRLQSSLARLIEQDDPEMRKAAVAAAGLFYRRAVQTFDFAPDADRLKASTAQAVLDHIAAE